MWKWTLLWGIFVVLFFSWAPAVLVAVTSCSTSPPLPPDGLVWPINGQVTEGWSLVCNSDRGHRGIDIEAPAGSFIKAAASGIVSFAGYTPAEGGSTTVSITHPGGLRSTYLHLDQVLVSPGQEVSQNQVIGTSAGPIIHFGLKTPAANKDIYFNPLDYLKVAPPAANQREATGTETVNEPASQPVDPPPVTPAPAGAESAAPLPQPQESMAAASAASASFIAVSQTPAKDPLAAFSIPSFDHKPASLLTYSSSNLLTVTLPAQLPSRKLRERPVAKSLFPVLASDREEAYVNPLSAEESLLPKGGGKKWWPLHSLATIVATALVASASVIGNLPGAATNSTSKFYQNLPGSKPWQPAALP